MFTDELAYKILFVKQSPQLVRFLPLTPSPSVRRRHESVAEMEDDHARQYRWEFTYTLCYFFGHEDTSFAEDGGDILVLRDCTFLGDLRCCTDFEAEPWNDFVAKLPFVPASRPRQCAEQSLIGEGGDAQWINEIIEENRLRRERTRKVPYHDDSVSDGVASSSDDSHYGSSDDATMWEALALRRGEWMADPDHETTEAFGTCIRGGAWTRRNRGVIYDFMVAQPRLAVSRECCRIYSLQSSYSFSMRKYGERNSCHMAREVCKRLEHFFGMWMSQEDSYYQFSASDLASYHESAEFVDFLLDVIDSDDAVYDKAKACRDIVPVNPELEE